MREIMADHDGQCVLIADGLSVGVIANFTEPDAVAQGPLLHVVGGEERVQLLQTLERTAAGTRLAAFDRIVDEPLSLDDEQAMREEAEAARAMLLAASDGDGDFELLLCHLDDELLEEDEGAIPNPSVHPAWSTAAKLPEDPRRLAFWLGCRLPLTTALRAHLLALQSPLKRLRDAVDALRLLSDPSLVERRRFAKFAITWHTAEASGCELAPPRPVVHWRGVGNDVALSRY